MSMNRMHKKLAALELKEKEEKAKQEGPRTPPK
jgi:hypothetical protein